MYAQNGTAQEQTVTMHVSGMTCGTCPISVRHRALQLKGVHTAAVDLDTATATVTYEDSEQSPQTIAQAITKLGYPATVRKAK
jgi:mercuric ion binding protein